MKIAMAQFNPIVGDIVGNTRRMGEFIDRGAEAGADLVVFPELSVVGYPPRDLLRKGQFVSDSVAAVDELAGRCRNIAALVGFVRHREAPGGRPLENVAALLADGVVKDVHVKALLPTYDVFDETRYFQPGQETRCMELGGMKLGVSICEDLWDAESLGRELYGDDPVGRLKAAGAEIIINMAASPFQVHKAGVREALFARQAARCSATIIYVNQVGGNDDLVFDGGSCVVTPDEGVIGRATSFDEDMLVVDTVCQTARLEPLGEPIARLSAALQLGLRDYIYKCGFSSVVLGLSGGIDSAVVAVLAVRALGAENVVPIAMPSRFSSDHSVDDARALAHNCGLELGMVAIEPMHATFEQELKQLLTGGNVDLAAENIQARIRGNIIMAVSNAHGHLPLATGNKSELSVGYCTLYGDMCGGLAPIGDVLKTDVYRLATQLNVEAGMECIPANIIDKAPSAELKADQFDQDKLPPYDLLDAILKCYIEEDLTAEQIVASGLDEPTVRRVVRMVDASEYKRRQAAPTLKVSARAFGTGRRVPIAQRYI